MLCNFVIQLMHMQEEVVLQDVVIKFAGDSGDGMQLTGNFPGFPCGD
jgi:hypothetical protein